MNKLPPVAEELLRQARLDLEPSAATLERSLDQLHAKLSFADVPTFDPEVDGSPSYPGAGTSAASSQAPAATLLTAKTFKLVLAGAALGSAILGGQALLSHGAPRAREPAPLGTSSGARSADQASVSEGHRAAGPSIEQNAPADAHTAIKQARHDSARVDMEPSARAPSFVPAESSERDERRSGRAPSIDREGTSRPRLAGAGRPAQAPNAARKETSSAAMDDGAQTSEELLQPMPKPSELDLLARSLSHLRIGAGEAALEVLEQQQTLYPAGQFVTERRGIRVLALCAAGRVSEGRRERAAFLQDAGAAPIAARVRLACAETDAP